MTLIDQLVARLVQAMVSQWDPRELNAALEREGEVGQALFEDLFSDPRSDDYEVLVMVRVMRKEPEEEKPVIALPDSRA